MDLTAGVFLVNVIAILPPSLTPTTMVVPHQVGDLVRSFVRIPGSGSEKSAKPVFCDLARASTLAATIPNPYNLPPATNVLRQSPSSFEIPNNQRQKRLRSEENKDISHLNPVSKAKIGRTESKPAYIPVKTIPVTLMAVRISNAEVQKLKEENEQLQKENTTFKKQISIFKQLIKSPQRLNSVLRRLEEKAQEA